MVDAQGSGLKRLASAATSDSGRPAGLESGVGGGVGTQRAGVRDNIYRIISQLKHVEDAKRAADSDRKEAKDQSALSTGTAQQVEKIAAACDFLEQELQHHSLERLPFDRGGAGAGGSAGSTGQTHD